MASFAFILILIATVIASQPLARLVRFVPLPVLQIAMGAALAWPVTGGVHVELEPELFLLVFIPPLLFADAWQAPKREYKMLRGPILSLAIGLVFFTIVTFGYALHWLVPAVPLAVAFALAAVLSPTDAVAVSSIVDKKRIPARLFHILEGESLFNDASGLVMFRFATAAALTGGFSLVDASTSFIFAVLGGAVAGMLALFIAGKALKLLIKIEGMAPEAQVLVMLLLPFGAYLLAESWHASGVLAAVIAGLNLGRLRAFNHLGVTARMLSSAMWTMLSFALNGAIFVFLGLQLPAIIRKVPPEISAWHPLWQPLGVVVALTVCLILLRYAWINGAVLLGNMVNRWRGLKATRVSQRAKLAGSVAGVRGAITLAGVLSLPLAMPDGAPFPARDLSIFLAAGVILCWLAIASVFLPRIARSFDVESGEASALEERTARVASAEAAIARLESVANGDAGDDGALTTEQAVAEGLIAAYRRRIAALDEGETVREEGRALQRAEGELRRLAIEAEREAVHGMLARGEISDETQHRLLEEIVLGEALVASRRKKA